MKSLLFALAALLFFAGCKKEPGEGGRAEIQGIVYEQRYTGNFPVSTPYPLGDQRVYIIYGDGTYSDNDTHTDPNGKYHFPWLRKGAYKIYVRSECNAYQNCMEGIYANVEISGKKDVVQGDTLFVKNY